MIRVIVLHNIEFGSGVVDSSDDTEPPDTEPPDTEPPGTEPPDSGSLALRGDEAGAEVVEVAHAITTALRTLRGVWSAAVPVESIDDVYAAVRQWRPHVVFNLCESLKRNARYEPLVASALARTGVGFTGSPAATLRLCLSKYSCNAALDAAGVAVPPSLLCSDPNRLPAALEFPLFVKPSGEDGSVGITAASIVRDRESLRERVAEVVRDLRQPALVQGFRGVREVNVSLLGDGSMRMLPVAEIAFDTSEGAAPIVTYASKWIEDSVDWRATPVVDADLDKRQRAKLAHTARAAARALGLRDYARLDIRIDEAGRMWVIDVNPNCDLAPDAGFARASRRAGMSYPELCWTIVHGALRRARVQPAQVHAPGSRRRPIRQPLRPDQPAHLNP